jgi:hypothetical protein
LDYLTNVIPPVAYPEIKKKGGAPSERGSSTDLTKILVRFGLKVLLTYYFENFWRKEVGDPL